jgi:hypothetical protein
MLEDESWAALRDDRWQMTKSKRQMENDLALFRGQLAGGDEGSRTLIVRFTRPTLCYPVELHRRSGTDFQCQKPDRQGGPDPHDETLNRTEPLLTRGLLTPFGQSQTEVCAT